MISLATPFSSLVQAGVDRLHLTLRRIRREKHCTELLSPLNTEHGNPFFAISASHYLEGGHSLRSGLEFKLIYLGTVFFPDLLTGHRKGAYTFPAAKRFNRMPLPCRRRAGRAGRQYGRNFTGCKVSISIGSTPETIRKDPLAPIPALPEPCFTRVAHKPR